MFFYAPYEYPHQTLEIRTLLQLEKGSDLLFSVNNIQPRLAKMWKFTNKVNVVFNRTFFIDNDLTRCYNVVCQTVVYQTVFHKKIAREGVEK